jgi:protein Xni
MKVRFLAIDGFNLIRRIYEARNPLSATDMPAVVEAVEQSLQRALNRHKPTHAALVMEDHDRTWRHLLYPDYKANRSPTPELLLQNLEAFSRAAAEVGIASCSVSNYEADDVIATIATVVAEHDGEVVILSTDKVFLQLLRPTVIASDHFNDRTHRVDVIESDYGIRPEQYVDYLALVGDKSNNVKGVPGIGPKSAVELLTRYSTLDAIMEASDDRLAEKVQAAEAEARRCRQLVQLKTDVELNRNLKSFRVTIPG